MTKSLRSFSHAMVPAMLMVSGAAAKADLTYWPPQYAVDRTQCEGQVASTTITVGGTWFCPAIPTGMHASVSGSVVTITVEWAFPAPPPCAAMPTPWSYRATIPGLAEDATYSTVAVFQGPLNLAPAAVGPFTADCACRADVDDGSNHGHPDGGVGIEDLLYYLTQYSAGAPRADIDDGSGTGTRDGGVGIEDLLYYLVRYNNGC